MSEEEHEPQPFVKMIDTAWERISGVAFDAMNSEQRDDLYFLRFAFNLPTTQGGDALKSSIEKFMQERKRLKADNPYYIPNRTPEYVKIRFGDDNLTGLDFTKSTKGRKHTINQSTYQGMMHDGELLFKKKTDLKLNDQEIKLDAIWREQYRMVIYNGQFIKKDASTELNTGTYNYILTTTGDLFCYPDNLSSEDIMALSLRRPVLAAGKLQIMNNKLTSVYVQSDCYQPTLLNTSRALTYFQAQGVDLSEVRVRTSKDPAAIGMIRSEDDAELRYEMPAIQLCSQQFLTCVQHLKYMQREFDEYEQSGVTKFYQAKDKWLGTNLTSNRLEKMQEIRAMIADVTKELLMPESGFNLKSKVQDMQNKLDEFQQLNRNLKSGGRLNAKIDEFKGRLRLLDVQLKQEKDTAPEDKKLRL